MTTPDKLRLWIEALVDTGRIERLHAVRAHEFADAWGRCVDECNRNGLALAETLQENTALELRLAKSERLLMEHYDGDWDVVDAALAGEEPCPCGREGSLDHEDFCEEAP